jgi:N-acetylglucosaminyldiphosphoundecaprenol N-acetyl-beta-D-mannosaminyltransferase
MADSVANILGVTFDIYDLQSLLNTLANRIAQNQKTLMLSGNVYSFNLAVEQPWLRDFLNKADMIRIDGAGLRLGGRILGYDLPPRMTWADFAWDLAERAERENWRVFLLGAKPGVAEQAAEKLKAHSHGLEIAGIHHGYFNKTSHHPENEAVLQKIREVQPDLLIIGFGMPLQEKWLSENWDAIDAKAVLTGGAVFDYISGNLQRAPDWMTNNGLEWLGRMLIEPTRLWKRYMIGNPQFLGRVFWQKIAGNQSFK